jgi:hypothetical protein
MNGDSLAAADNCYRKLRSLVRGTSCATAACMRTPTVILTSLSIPLTILMALPAVAQTRGAELPEVRADSPSGVFGLEGQLAISSDAGLSISNTSVDGIDGSSTTVLMRPAVDYFVIDNLSIGGFLGVEHSSAPGGKSTAFSVGPRVGYNIPLSERLSVWPKLGFSFASTSQEADEVTLPGGTTVDGDEETSTSVQLNLFAPVMFHPVQHFFIGFGPALDVDLSGDSKATTIAARLTLGGWL